MRILVTGGARRIGAEIVRRLAARGHQVALHYHRSAQAAEALADTLRATGGRVELVSAELGDPTATRALIAQAAEALGGPVEGLVNNASRFAFDQVPITDYDLLDLHMHVNLGAPVLLASALAEQPDLEAGAVVNLLDQKVANLNPDFFSYSCSKIALHGATEMLARALAPRVRVNAVSPGLSLPSLDQTSEEFGAASRENLLQRPVAVGDVAATVEMLLTTPSITGQNVFVDCGQRFLPRDGDVMFATRDRPNG